MAQRISWLITDQNITVNYNGQTHIVPQSAGLAKKLIEAIKANKLDDIPNYISISKQIEHSSKGAFKVKDGQILINGVLAPRVLSEKILKFYDEGLPYEPLIKFAENLQKNPSFRAVNELFQFLEKNDHPITENGNFIAYKKVRSDFLDAYSRTIDNSVGKTVEIPRNQVNEDPNQTCSYGLHVANWHYAYDIYNAGENSKMLEVEVNPADVVAVPTDYNQAKMRVSKYIVLGVVDQENSVSSLRITNTKKAVMDKGCCSSCEECCDCGDDEDYDDYDDTEEDSCMYCKNSDCYDDDCLNKQNEKNDEYPWDDELDI